MLSPVARFPAFVERLESVCKNGRSEAADMTYNKLSVALLQWVEKIAKLNEKYQNVVIMENTHFF